MRRSDDRILTTHVGSLIRPRDLLELAAAAKDKPDQRQKFLDAVRAATLDVVKRQISAEKVEYLSIHTALHDKDTISRLKTMFPMLKHIGVAFGYSL
jgi:uncharacterized protein YjgD (DUF1641 family)